MTHIFMAREGCWLHLGPEIDSFCCEKWTVPQTITNFFAILVFLVLSFYPSGSDMACASHPLCLIIFYSLHTAGSHSTRRNLMKFHMVSRHALSAPRCLGG